MKNIKPEKDKYAVGGTGGLKQKESEPRYPTIRIDHKHLPEAKNSSLGEMHHVEMMLKMVGNNQSRHDNSGEYEIHQMGHKGVKKQPAEDTEEAENVKH